MMRPTAGTGRTKDARRLGELLVEERIITSEQLEKAVREQEQTGGYIGQILVQKGFATDQAISEYLVRQFKIPRLSLLDYDINDKVLRQIPEDVCLRLRLLAIDKLGRILTVAMVDPLDKEALEEIQGLCPELRIKPILCDWDHFEAVSKRLFGKVPKKPEFYAALRMEAPVKDVEMPAEPADTVSVDLLGARARPGTPADTTRELAETLREGLRDALRDVMKNITPAVIPGPSAETVAMGDLASRIESTVQDSMRMVAEEFRRVSADLKTNINAVRSPGETVVPGPSAEDVRNLARGIQEGVGEVMTKAMASLGEEMRAVAGRRAGDDGESKGLTPADIAEAMRQTLGPALESSIGNLGRELRDALTAQQAAQPSPQPVPDWGQLAGNIQDSIGGAVEDAMAEMAVQIKSVFIQREARDAEEQRRDITLLAERLRETMVEAVSDLRSAQRFTVADVSSGLQGTQSLQEGELAHIAEAALQSIAAESRAAREAQQAEMARLAEMTLQSIANARESQETQQSQLAKIAEASMQSVRQTTELIEKHIFSESSRRDLLRGRSARHASVAPFGGVNPETPPTPEALEADSRLLDALDSETPLESLTFANFFPGSINEFTHKVGQAVAAAPGGEYNPFFLYGHVGTGKTHLVSAIGNAILSGESRKDAPRPRVGYVSASHFARRLAEAIMENAQDAFRENYSHWDALILDDIQFLGGRVEAQEEFFHIFNALHQQGRQIIIVADKAPDRLGLLEQRLVSRFASGIVAELRAPEWDTRMQILRHRVELSGVAVPDEILSLIAMRVPGDVRKMTGSLRKVAAFAKLIGKNITVEMAQEILSHLGGEDSD
jgi:chromosomal replication initiator protein DnaA